MLFFILRLFLAFLCTFIHDCLAALHLSFGGYNRAADQVTIESLPPVAMIDQSPPGKDSYIGIDQHNVAVLQGKPKAGVVPWHCIISSRCFDVVNGWFNFNQSKTTADGSFSARTVLCIYIYTSWWLSFNPSEKYAQVKLNHLPTDRVENKKNV